MCTSVTVKLHGQLKRCIRTTRWTLVASRKLHCQPVLRQCLMLQLHLLIKLIVSRQMLTFLTWRVRGAYNHIGIVKHVLLHVRTPLRRIRAYVEVDRVVLILRLHADLISCVIPLGERWIRLKPAKDCDWHLQAETLQIKQIVVYSDDARCHGVFASRWRFGGLHWLLVQRQATLGHDRALHLGAVRLARCTSSLLSTVLLLG